MGYFTQAKKLEDVFSTSIEAVVLQVTYPVLVEVKDNFEKLKNVLKQFNSLLLYVVAPLMLLLNLLAAPIIELLLGEQWLPAVPYLEILAFQGIAISLQGVNYNAIASIGRSKELFQGTIIKRSMSVVLLISGMYLGGVKGILWGMTISSYFICFYNSVLVHKFVGYTLFRQFSDLFLIILLNAISYTLAYASNSIVKEGYILHITMFIVYVISYLLLSFILKISIIGHIKPLLVKINFIKE